MAKKAFISDDEMAKMDPVPAGKSPGFISDDEMEKMQPTEKPWYDISAKGLAKGAAEALPAAGGLAGGALGLLAGPVGAVGGAGLGAAGGKALQNLVEKYALGEEGPQTRGELYGGIAKSGLEGAAGEAMGPIMGKVGESAAAGLKKTVSNLSKIPEKAIETYSKRGKDVDKLVEQFGGETPQIADQVRTDIAKRVDTFKNVQNAKITKSLEDSNKLVDITPVYDNLEKSLNKLDPSVDGEKITRIQKQLGLLSDVISEAGGTGEVPVQRAYSVQKHLQDQADYLAPGAVLKKKDFVDVAMERGAADARKIVNRGAPEIADANKNLSGLRRLDKNMNRNLLKLDKPEAGLISAGSGMNPRNMDQLRKLEQTVDGNFTRDIENLGAAKYFGDAGFLPQERTGSALVPLGLGGGYGLYELSKGNEEEAMKGLLLGALGSPLAIKYGIKGSNLLGEALPYGTSELMKQLPRGLLQRPGRD